MYCPACGHANPPGSDACGNCMLDLSHLHEPLLIDKLERGLMTEPVVGLNPREPVTIADTAALGQALALMIERGVGAVLVTDPAGRLAGILTERDFLAKVAGRPDFAALPARDFMTASPETLAPTDTLAFAVGKMDAGGYRHLPVVADGRPVGVVSVRDVLRSVTRLCRD